jgi:predicted alpha/beta superfamily hydrolase
VKIIIVGVDNTMDRTDEYTYSYDPSEKAGGKGDLYLDFLHDEVLPIIKVCHDPLLVLLLN